MRNLSRRLMWHQYLFDAFEVEVDEVLLFTALIQERNKIIPAEVFGFDNPITEATDVMISITERR